MAYKTTLVAGTIQDTGELTNSSGFSFAFLGATNSIQNRIAILVVSARDATSSTDTIVTSATYNSLPMTEIETSTIGGGGTLAVRTTVLMLINPPVDDNAEIVVDLQGTCNQAMATMCTFYQVDPVTPQDTAAQEDSASAGITEINTTLTNERSIIVSALARVSDGTIVITRPSPSSDPGSTPTILTYNQGGTLEHHIFFGTSDILPNLTTIAQLTFTSSKYAHVVISLRPLRRRTHAS